MSLSRHAVRAAVCFLACATLVPAQALSTPDQVVDNPWITLLWQMPGLRLFAPEPPILIAPPLVPAVPSCLVLPLAPVLDADAAAFESQVSLEGAVDIAGLTPAAARALVSFERTVEAYGGSFTVTSAYRPSAYQEHLQQVWDKWMIELQHNSEPGCQPLRAEVEREFIEHQLLVSQRPVSSSDHTRGIAFDAAVRLPRRAARRLDVLARRAGLVRPDASRDPVHFRLAYGRA